MYGSNTVISTIFFLGILAFIALIAQSHPWRKDFTESGAFTLSEQTMNILKSIDKPVEIKAFFATADQGKARDLLDTYHYANDKVSYEFIDPDRQPEAAKRYDVRNYGSVVVEGYGKKQPIQTLDEETLTNAILKLTQQGQKTVYFLAGHGERSGIAGDKEGYSTVRSTLQKDNYKAADLNLLQQAEVPKDAAAVVVAGPRKPLMPQEIQSLKTYLDGGGRMMVLVDPFQDGGLRDFLKAYGILLADDIVIDKLSRVFGGSYTMPVVMQYGQHRITEGFNVATFYPEARSVTAAQDPPKGVKLDVLASTSENAWSERDMASVDSGKVSYDAKTDVIGPVPLVVIAQIDESKEKSAGDSQSAKEKDPGKAAPDKKDLPSRKAELLVAGNSSFADDTYFGLSGNGDLFLNMANYLAQEETLITIKPREKAGKPILLSKGQGNLILWTCLFAPLLALLSGVTVYRIRRSQR